MKTTLFLATSLDGFIAKSDDSVTWSQDVWDNYGKLCTEIGNLIVGRRTFELMKELGDFEKMTLKNVVVLTSSQIEEPGHNAVCAASPKEALTLLKSKGCDEALIGGGRATAHSFLTDKLITEIQLDVEPTIYGSGIPLFGEISDEIRLDLVEVRKAGAATVRLHYKVI